MNRREYLVLGFLVAAIGFSAQAQILIGDEIQVSSGTGVTGLEPAIAASPTDVVVSWQVSGGIRYRASINAGLSFDSNGSRSLTPPCGGTGSFDPLAGSSVVTGNLWVGGCGNTIDYRTVFVGKKTTGQYTTGSTVSVNSCNDAYEDKAFIAIGPREHGQSPSDTSEAMYAAWSRDQANRNLYFARSSNTGGPAEYWNEAPAPITSDPQFSTRHGHGAFPVVLRTGSNRGRVLVASTFGQQGPPEYTRTDDEGATWLVRQALNAFGSTSTPITAAPCCPNSWSYVSAWPSVAIDPADSNHIVIAFASSADSAENADIFIAESTNGGDSFPLASRYHFDDAALRKTGDSTSVSHEFMPTVAIDAAGGICLMFCRLDTAETDVDGVSIRFARWTSGSALSSPPTLLQDFVTRFVPVGFSVGADANDFQMIVSGGCYVHCAYVHNDASENTHVYYRRVRICIPPEIDGIMVVDERDAAAFNEAFAQGSGRADVNHDGLLDARDVTDFAAAWSAATNR